MLSLGWKEIPQSFKPALCIRLGRSEPTAPPPFGIIHSCPGMDWRHVGLPPAEYLYWMSQVPANGGYIWHSITGIPDTIGDKRILECVRTINTQIRVVEGCMDGARLPRAGRPALGHARRRPVQGLRRADDRSGQRLGRGHALDADPL